MTKFPQSKSAVPLKNSVTEFPISTSTPSPTLMVDGQAGIEAEGNLLFTVSPGIAQWYDIYYMTIQGESQKNCMSCDSNVVFPTGSDDEAKFWSPAWAPSGSIFTYAVLSESPDYLPIDSIMVSQLNLSDRLLISDVNAWYNNLAWSPDGQYIVYSRNNNIDGRVDVCYITIEGNAPSEHCAPIVDDNKINTNPTWSPDGKSILFTSAGDKYRFYLWNIEDNTVTQFTDISGDDLFGKWSPDGSKFAYVIGTRVSESGFVPYEYNLYIADADGSNRQIVPNTNAAYDFDWSPDGKKIVFTQRSPIENDPCDVGCLPFTVLKIIDLETGEITSLTDGTEWIGDPAWRP